MRINFKLYATVLIAILIVLAFFQHGVRLDRINNFVDGQHTIEISGRAYVEDFIKNERPVEVTRQAFIKTLVHDQELASSAAQYASGSDELLDNYRAAMLATIDSVRSIDDIMELKPFWINLQTMFEARLRLSFMLTHRME